MPTKPAAGTAVNSGNSIASGMVVALLFAEGSGTSLANSVSGGSAATATNMGWGSGQYGGAAGSLNSSNITVPMPAVGPAISILVSCKADFTSSGMMVEREAVNATWEFFFESGSLRWRGSSATDRADISATSGFTNNAWHQFAVNDDGTLNPQLVWVDGVSGNVSGVGVSPPASNTNTVHIGNFDLSGYYLTGLIDYVYIWNRAITSTEIAALFADPFQIFGSSGTAYTQTLTASMATHAAGIARRTGRPLLASAATQSGALNRRIPKSLTASAATCAGALVRSHIYNRALAASMAVYSGALKRLTGKGLTASAATVSGALARRVGVPLAASMATHSAAVTKTVNRLLTASAATFAGAFSITKLLQRSLTASLPTFAGGIAKQSQKALTATPVPWSASLSRQFPVRLTASLATFGAVLTKTTARAVSASMAVFSGIVSGNKLANVIQKALTASMATMSGAFTKTPGKAIAASMALPAANLNKSTARALPASLAAFSAALGKGYARTLAASMPVFTAALTKRTVKSLAASMATFAGAEFTSGSRALSFFASMAAFTVVFAVTRLGEGPGFASLSDTLKYKANLTDEKQ